jgi:hypothetical protein
MGLYQGQVINLDRLLGYSFLVPSTIFQQKLVGSISGILIKTTPTPLTKLAHMAATAAMASGVIDEIPESIDSSPGSTSDGPFRLLDLPSELVDRVTSFVNSEGLIATRQACKALEAITFERFAAENFERIYCFIQTNQDFDRLKDIIRLSPRLSSRIRQLTLTGDILRGRPFNTICSVRYDFMDLYESQFWTMFGLYAQDHKCVKTLNVLRSLRDTSSLPQHISLAVDLAIYAYSQTWEDYCCPPQQVVLLSLVMSGLKVHSLRVDSGALQNSGDLLAHERAGIVNAMSILTTFEFIGYLLDDQIPMYEEILRGAPQLRNVAFDTSITVQDSISIFPLSSQLALVNSISALASLRITRAIFIGGSLVQALRHCQSTLNSLVLRHVGLSISDEGWVTILQALLAAPNLIFVELQLIQAASADTLWRDGQFKVPCKHGCQEPHIFEGRGQVMDGLRSLLEHHSCLHI